MTKKEVIQILAVLKEAGVAFNNSNETVLVQLWEKCFKDIPYKQVSQAVFELINSPQPLFLNGLIGKIKEKIINSQNKFLDFNTVWQMVLKAAHQTYPDIPEESIKAFNNLPPMVKYLVGGVANLENIEYAIKPDILETVVKSNMKKLWAELIQQTVEAKMLNQPAQWELQYLPPTTKTEKLQAEKVNLLVDKIMETKM